MGERKVVHHAVEQKVVAYEDTSLRKIYLIFLEKVYVLALSSIYKNHVKLLRSVVPVHKLYFERVPVNCVYAVIQPAVVDVLLCLNVTVYIKLNSCYSYIVSHVCKLNCRKTDGSSNFKDTLNIVFFDITADKINSAVAHNRDGVFGCVKFDVVQSLHDGLF